MPGIISIKTYIPFYRMDKRSIFNAWGWFNSSGIKNSKGEIAFANYDEDSTTMSVAASSKCLKRVDKESIDALYFATTTSPYKESLNASIIAAASDLKDNIVTADIANSVKAATTGIIMANDAIKSGRANNIMVCAADTRLAKPADTLEYLSGHGAAAVVVGKENTIADIEITYSTTSNFFDYRKTQNDTYPKSWEERWVRDEGFINHIVGETNRFIEESNYKISDFRKIIYACPDHRTYALIAKKLKLSNEQLEDTLVNEIGYTATPHTILMLLSALGKSKSKDKILLINYGNGIDILVLSVTENITEKSEELSLKKEIETKMTIDNYTKFAAISNKIEPETGPRGEVAKSALSVMWRERKSILCLYGSACKTCGTKMYPPQHVCVNPSCRDIDRMEDYRFSDKTGRLFTFTIDNLAFSPNPPAIYGMVDFDGGGRYWFDITDCSPDEIEVGMPIGMSFRRKFYDEPRGLYGYFWKAVPIKENGGKNE